MVIKKLDARHSFHDRFEYMIQFRRTSYSSSRDRGIVGFIEAQKWFTETYGFSTEIDLLGDLDRDRMVAPLSAVTKIPEYIQEINWAYSTNKNRVGLRIYTNEAELTFFYLAFSG